MLLCRRVHATCDRVNQQQTDLSLTSSSRSHLVLLTTRQSHTPHLPQLQLQRLLHLLQQLLSAVHSRNTPRRIRTASGLVEPRHDHLLLPLISPPQHDQWNQLVQLALTELGDTHLRQIQMEREQVLPLLVLGKLLDQIADVLNGVLPHTRSESPPCSLPSPPRSASQLSAARLSFTRLSRSNPSSSECVRIGTPSRCGRGRSAAPCATPDCPPDDSRTVGNRCCLPHLSAISDSQHVFRQGLRVTAESRQLGS